MYQVCTNHVSTIVSIGADPGFTLRAHQQVLPTGPFGNTCRADVVSHEADKRGVTR
jgi:hypothetical protein